MSQNSFSLSKILGEDTEYPQAKLKKQLSFSPISESKPVHFKNQWGPRSKHQRSTISLINPSSAKIARGKHQSYPSLEIEEDVMADKQVTTCSTQPNQGGDEEFVGFEQSDFSYESQVKSSLPSAGIMQPILRPTTAFCPTCQVDVHTQLSSKNDLSTTLLHHLESLFKCCNFQLFSSQMVHRCTNCNSVIAES